MKITRFSAALCIAVALAASPSYAQPVAQPATLVTVDAVVREAFTEEIPIIGRLVAVQDGAVASRIAGTVAEILAEVGDRVRRGEVLARLSTELLEVQSRRAKAARDAAAAQLALAELTEKRLSGLTDSAAISRAAYDEAVQQKHIAAARAREAESAFAQAELELTYAEIRAPFDGVLTARFAEVGSFLQRGQDIARLLADRRLEAEADIPHNRIGGIRLGGKVAMRLDDDREHMATVRAVIPQEDPRTRTRRVRFSTDLGGDAGAVAADFSAAPKWLAAEQSVTLLIPAGAAREVISVHKDAVIRRGAAAMVFVVTDGVAQPRPVRLGAAAGARLEVLDGLAPGELVVVRGNERLQPNQSVRVAE